MPRTDLRVKCYVSTRGNPDFNQYAPVSNPVWMHAENIEELRAKLRGYQDFYMVGGGNWNSPVVYLTSGSGKKRVGRLSYNLRLWDKNNEVISEPMNHDVIEYDEEE